ncbi:MAG TPA: PAS domain-containing protein [Jatrophihabitans sp.]|nr:PAS domain-containing protein [Jatrophihabitans sp.]
MSEAFSPVELLESLGQAVIATDPGGTVVHWNRVAEELYGWSAEEAVGRNIADVTVPEISQELAAAIMAALRAGSSWSGGFPVHDRSGRIFPALVTDSGIYRDGDLVGIVGISTHLGTALRPLLERSSDAALVVTADGIVSYASPAVQPLFGWQPDDLVGKPLTDLVHPADQEQLSAGLQGPTPVLELRLQSPAGWVTSEAALTNLLDDPVVHGLVCNLHRSERLARLQERERISQTVHADILQLLYSATLDLDALVSSATAHQHAAIDSATGRIAQAIGQLRALVRAEDG